MTNILKPFATGIATLSLCVLSSLSWAQDFPTQKVLPLELSAQAAMAAIKKCHDDGFKVSVAIVDQSGLLKVQLKADGAGPHTLDSSRRKAYTANGLRDSTQKYAVLVTQKPELQSLTRRMKTSCYWVVVFRSRRRWWSAVLVGGAPGLSLMKSVPARRW